MITIFVLLAFILLTQFVGYVLVPSGDKRWICGVMAIAWVVFLPLLILVNSRAPFGSGGDDMNYFSLAATPFHSISEAADVTAFASMEQPGYPLVLSVLYQITGPDLLAFKALNLCWFILLGPISYRIGIEIGGQRLARGFAIAVLLMTPLWFYWLALLKDMTIVFLQMIFVLASILLWRGRGAVAWIAAGASTVALLLFRTPLVVVNLILLATVCLQVIVFGGYRRVPTLATGIVIVGLTLVIAANPTRMASFGITNEQRVLGAGMSELTTTLAEQSVMSRGLFPLLYIVIETSGLHPNALTPLTLDGLRGLLAAPWILFGLPYFAIGLSSIFTARGAAAGLSLQDGSVTNRVLATPWAVLLLLVAIYTVISWTVGDTTRWRIPDLPVFAGITAYGFLSVGLTTRIRVSVMWLAAAVVTAITFRMLQG